MRFLPHVLVFLAGIVLTAALIYLTPLKWLNVIEPAPHDIAPTDFNAKYVANPDDYLFIDVRPLSAYEAQHAKGARNMPIQTLYDLHGSLPKSGKKIVLICSGGQASGVAAMYLQHYGFFNVDRIEGGIENWITEGLPVEGTKVSK